ncbi:hypothetical protein [Burkholderia territorii]|uniref:hypothetical protein n=1 Tax=Burkholderia territorii TaxID=1503055 RepID=UPI0012D9769D|nr:hypothetical protein [Burkholderia territorii]
MDRYRALARREINAHGTSSDCIADRCGRYARCRVARHTASRFDRNGGRDILSPSQTKANQ